MIFLQFFVGAQLVLIVFLFIVAGSRYKEVIRKHGNVFQFSFMAPTTLYLVDRFRIMERFSRQLNPIHHKIILIYGSKDALILSRLFLAQLLSAFLLILFLFSIFSVLGQDIAVFFYGVCISLLAPFVLIKGLSREVRKKHNQIIMELPEFLNKLILLVNAGETVQKAIIRCVEQKRNPEDSYLYTELVQVVNQLRNSYSFSQVLEDFNKRCAVQEVSIFTTTVLLNYRRGGAEFVLALRDLSRILWEKRKALSRTLGEQASSKLVFPMVLIFLVVLLIIATPAIMLF